MLRSGYSTDFRLFNDSDQTTRGTWYRVPFSNKPFPGPTFMASREWLREGEGNPNLGEVPGARRKWYGTTNPFGYPGTCHIGTDDQWHFGLSVNDLSQPAPKLHPCCFGRPPGHLRLRLKLSSKTVYHTPIPGPNALCYDATGFTGMYANFGISRTFNGHHRLPSELLDPRDWEEALSGVIGGTMGPTYGNSRWTLSFFSRPEPAVLASYRGPMNPVLPVTLPQLTPGDAPFSSGPPLITLMDCSVNKIVYNFTGGLRLLLKLRNVAVIPRRWTGHLRMLLKLSSSAAGPYRAAGNLQMKIKLTSTVSISSLSHAGSLPIVLRLSSTASF